MLVSQAHIHCELVTNVLALVIRASFHPLTNRKHHCRLCGKIICSLPVKQPQRPQPCSLLFVVDQTTRRIEEVTEVVDYGVRPRRQSSNPTAQNKGKDKSSSVEDKFLKGVRICRECKPVMLSVLVFSIPLQGLFMLTTPQSTAVSTRGET